MSLSRSACVTPVFFLYTWSSSAECSISLVLFCGATKSSEVTELVLDLSEIGEEGGGVLLFAGGVVWPEVSGGNPLEGGGGGRGGDLVSIPLDGGGGSDLLGGIILKLIGILPSKTQQYLYALSFPH